MDNNNLLNVKNKIQPNKILSRRGYSLKKTFLDSKQLKELKKELSVSPISNFNCGGGMPMTQSFKIYKESEQRIYIPKMYGLNKYGDPDINKIKDSTGDDISIDFKGDMRDKQKPVINDFLKACQERGGGLVCLPCGFGKTIIGLKIFSELKKKTLIVCHKEFLLNQWEERIQMFLPEAKIGRIQQKKVDIEDKDIVLGMLQSIAMKDYPTDTFDSFGFIIFDECHHLGAEVFSKSLLKLNTNYMLGLSATPDRKDGLSKVFEFYLGDMVYCIKDREPDTVDVKLIKYSNDDPIYCLPEMNYTGKMNLPAMITKVCSYENRTKIFLTEIEEMVKINRRILVLSERRKHLVDFYNYLVDNKICSCGYYVGGMKQKDLDESATKQVVLGTFHLASEGMDVPSLNTIILASPKTDIQQSIGRIFRQKPEEREHNPLIIDLIDDTIPSFKRQFTKRNKIYKDNNYNIKKVIINENKKGNGIQIQQEIKFDGCIL
jgi:superfamily II DNA or RNA helicase